MSDNAQLDTEGGKPDLCLILFLAIAGVALCAAVVFSIDASGTLRTFKDQPSYLVWFIFVLMEGAVVGIFVWPLCKNVRKLQAGPSRVSAYKILLFAFEFLLLAFVPAMCVNLFLVDIDFVLPWHRAKAFVLLSIGMLVVVPAALGVYSVQQICHSPTSSGNLQLRELRRKLQFFLVVLGWMVALLTLTVGAARKALADGGADLPSVLVLPYGFYSSFLVALVYIPAALALEKAGQELNGPNVKKHDEEVVIEEEHQRRKEEPSKDTNVFRHLHDTIPVLAPLFSGLISYVLG